MIRALYAEDDTTIAAIVRSYIEHFAPDWQLEVVTTGQACLARMERGGIDILLLDHVLPDTDGLQILGELNRRGSPVPVVMVTGQGQTEFAVRAMRAGAADCVDKTSPQFLQLVEIVQRVQAREAERRVARPAGAPVPGHHQIVLIESSASLCTRLSEFFATQAPEFDLTLVAQARELEQFLATGAAADAVVIGPTPPGSRPLEVLRLVRYRAPVPILLLAPGGDSATAVAAFKLGAQDFLLAPGDWPTELAFSLNHVLRRTEMERQNLRLKQELAALNQSLEGQVAARTRELRALSLRLLRVQEEERQALARELHDEVGQLLTGLLFQLDAVAHAPGAGPLRPRLAEAGETATQLLEHVRRLTQQYRPQVLDDLGLRPALEWQARRLGQPPARLAVELDLALPAGRLPGELEIVVYRVVQEALANVVRHARTTAASVTVMADAGLLLVEITDRGCGFALAEQRARADTFGLASMRERVHLVGGRIELFSRPGVGTRIHAEFPLPAEPAPAAAAP